MHIVLGNGERERTASPTSSPTTGASAAASSTPSATRATEPYPCGTATSATARTVCERVVGRARPPRPRRRDPPRPDRAARRRSASRRSRGSATRRPTTDGRRGSPPPRSRSCASRPRSSSGRRRTGRTPTSCSPPEVERGLGAAPEPSPGDLFFDIEGDPFWEPRPRPRVPLRRAVVPAASGFTRSGRTTATRRGASRGRSSTSSTSASREHPDLHVYHYATLRADRAQAAHGQYGTREDEVDDLLRARDPRRPATRSSARGSGSRSRATRLKNVEQFYFERRGRAARRRRLDPALRALARTSATRRSSTGSRRTTDEDCLSTLAAPRLAARPQGRGRGGVGHGDPVARAARRRMSRRTTTECRRAGRLARRAAHARAAAGRAARLPPARGQARAGGPSSTGSSRPSES